MSYNYQSVYDYKRTTSPERQRVQAYERAVDVLGDSVLVGTKYPSMNSITKVFNKEADKYSTECAYQKVYKLLPKMEVNGRRNWTKEDDKFLITTICQCVNPRSTAVYDSTHNLSSIQRYISDITGRSMRGINQRCVKLGLRKKNILDMTIVGKDGVARSTKTGLPIVVPVASKPAPATIDLVKKPKAERKPMSKTGIKSINLGKNVSNVNITYTDTGEIQITFEG